MKKTQTKTITELRKTLFETFDEVADGQTCVVSHKNGSEIAMVPIDMIKDLERKLELHKNLAAGYAQAMRGEGISTDELKARLKNKIKELRKKYD
jgi:hypothetical protein